MVTVKSTQHQSTQVGLNPGSCSEFLQSCEMNKKPGSKAITQSTVLVSGSVLGLMDGKRR